MQFPSPSPPSRSPRRVRVSIGVACLLLVVATSLVGRAHAQAPALSITFFGQSGCDICGEKKAVVKDFVSEHPDVHVTYYVIDFNDFQNRSFAEGYFVELGVSMPVLPAAVLNATGEITILCTHQCANDITPEVLAQWYAGALENDTHAEMDAWVAFVAGIVVGGSPCVLLILSVLGTSASVLEDRRKYATIAVGLVLGIVAAYAIFTGVFLSLVQTVDPAVFTVVKWIFGMALLVVGIWQIAEFRSEHSTIFGTPRGAKNLMKSFVERRSGLYSFLLGLVFAFVKIPCILAAYMPILLSVRGSPRLIAHVLAYLGGMLLPIVVLLLAVGVGLQSDKINRARLRYRPILRLLSGCLLILLTLYLVLDLPESFLVTIMGLMIGAFVVAILVLRRRRPSVTLGAREGSPGEEPVGENPSREEPEGDAHAGGNKP